MTSLFGRRGLRAIGAVALVALLVGCSPGTAPSGSAVEEPDDPVATPTPTSTSPDEVAATDPDSGWLVTATTSLFMASTRLCPGDGFITTPDDPEWGAVRTEINGGPPDDWDGGTWEIDQGVTIDVAESTYYFRYTEGQDSYQVARGDLVVEFTADGRPLAGRGSGDMEVILADGGGEWRDDQVTFKVEPTAAPPWCDA